VAWQRELTRHHQLGGANWPLGRGAGRSGPNPSWLWSHCAGSSDDVAPAARRVARRCVRAGCVDAVRLLLCVPSWGCTCWRRRDPRARGSGSYERQPSARTERSACRVRLRCPAPCPRCSSVARPRALPRVPRDRERAVRVLSKPRTSLAHLPLLRHWLHRSETQREHTLEPRLQCGASSHSQRRSSDLVQV